MNLKQRAAEPVGLLAAEHSTLSDQVFSQLRTAIMSGQFAPGEKLTIRGLAGQLNTSPTPIREALRRLSAEGALEIAPNRFIRVPIMNPLELRELRDIRTALEGIATERAAQNITSAEFADLVTIDNNIRELRKTGLVKERIQLIRRFHFTIYEASQMPALYRMIQGLWLRSAPYSNLLFPAYSEMERGNLRSMTMSALKRHDGPSARRCMEADINGALDFIIDEIGSHRPARRLGRGRQRKPESRAD